MTRVRQESESKIRGTFACSYDTFQTLMKEKLGEQLWLNIQSNESECDCKPCSCVDFRLKQQVKVNDCLYSVTWNTWITFLPFKWRSWRLLSLNCMVGWHFSSFYDTFSSEYIFASKFLVLFLNWKTHIKGFSFKMLNLSYSLTSISYGKSVEHCVMSCLIHAIEQWSSNFLDTKTMMMMMMMMKFLMYSLLIIIIRTNDVQFSLKHLQKEVSLSRRGFKGFLLDLMSLQCISFVW